MVFFGFRRRGSYDAALKKARPSEVSAYRRETGSMHAGIRCILIAMCSLVCHQAAAQIYTCTAADGSRVFSDKRCGPDAKVVKGISSSKRTTAKPVAANTKPKSPEELQDLLKHCNGGDQTACMSWSKGGGPSQLRAEEKQQEVSCEGGSITACEQRYCRDGATEECRHRVMPLATLSGETWYLRFQQKRAADGPAVYSIRCMRAGSRAMLDVTVSCAAAAGPNRCQSDHGQESFPRLDAAASSYCSAPK